MSNAITKLDNICSNTTYGEEWSHSFISGSRLEFQYLRQDQVQPIINEAFRLQRIVMDLKTHCVRNGIAEYDESGDFNLTVKLPEVKEMA